MQRRIVWCLGFLLAPWAGCVEADSKVCVAPLPDGDAAACDAPIGAPGGPVPSLLDGWSCAHRADDGPGRAFTAYTDGSSWALVMDFDRVKHDADAFYRAGVKTPDGGRNQYWSAESTGFTVLDDPPRGEDSTVFLYYHELRLFVHEQGAWQPHADRDLVIADHGGDAYFGWWVHTDAGPFWLSPMVPRDTEGRHDKWRTGDVEVVGPDGRAYLGSGTAYGFRYTDLDMDTWAADLPPAECNGLP